MLPTTMRDAKRSIPVLTRSRPDFYALKSNNVNVINKIENLGIKKIDINSNKFALAKSLGATECINPRDHKSPIHEILIEMTGGGLDYTFEAVGNVELMRSALEACHKGWGECTVIGVAGAGQEISTRPFQLVTGRVWRGTAFGGVLGRSQLPGMVDEWLRGDFSVDPYITHHMNHNQINTAFDLLKAGESIRSVIHFQPNDTMTVNSLPGEILEE